MVDRNSDSGIYLTGGTTGVRVEGNVARGNARGYIRAAVGIELRDATGDVVAGNRSYGNEDSGIQLSAGAADDLVVNNIVFGNGDHGIHALDAARARIVGNSVYRNATTGINVEGGSTAR